jgi:hypothetical protein
MRFNKKNLTIIVLISISLLISWYWILISRRESNTFYDLSRKLNSLSESISNDSTIQNLIDKKIDNGCGDQNIGKTQKDLQCFSELRFIYRVISKTSAIETTKRIEGHVIRISLSTSYTTRVDVDSAEAWYYQSEPSLGYSGITCKFSYEYLVKTLTLYVSQKCYGHANKVYFL